MENDSEYYNRQGNQASNYNNEEEAIKYYKKAIELSPDTGKYYVNLGTSYENIKQFELAEEYIKKGISIEPDDLRFHFKLAEFYWNIERKDKSFKIYQEILSRDSSNGKAYCGIGRIYSEMEDYGKAVESFTKSIDLGYNNSDPYLYRAIVYNNDLLEYEKALADFKKAAELNPDDPLIPVLMVAPAANLKDQKLFDEQCQKADEAIEKLDSRGN